MANPLGARCARPQPPIVPSHPETANPLKNYKPTQKWQTHPEMANPLGARCARPQPPIVPSHPSSPATHRPQPPIVPSHPETANPLKNYKPTQNLQTHWGLAALVPSHQSSPATQELQTHSKISDPFKNCRRHLEIADSNSPNFQTSKSIWQLNPANSNRAQNCMIRFCLPETRTKTRTNLDGL